MAPFKACAQPRKSVIMPLCAVNVTAMATAKASKNGKTKAKTRRKRNPKMYANEKVMKNM